MFFILLSVLTVELPAAEKPSPTPEIILRALPVEKEKKPGFLQRIFKKKPTPAPTPEPTATPIVKPKPIKKRPKTPVVSADTKQPNPIPEVIAPASPDSGFIPLPETIDLGNSPAASGSAQLPDSLPPMVGGSVDNIDPEVTSQPPPVVAKTTDAIPTPAPLPPEIRNNPMNQPIPLVEDSMALQITTDTIASEANLEKDTIQRIQFRKIKTKALEDAKLLELKQKAETAGSTVERYKALKAYYPRLFASMRKIDETLSIQIDEMEAASRRRLERMEADGLDNPPAN